MQISSTNNAVNFKGLEYKESPALKKVIEGQKESTRNVLKNASKELAGKNTVLKIFELGSEFLAHYVAVGNVGLTYIDGATNEGNILKVTGYTYNENTGLKHTQYVSCDIPMKNVSMAEQYVRSINGVNYGDEVANTLARAVEVTKALDEEVAM